MKPLTNTGTAGTTKNRLSIYHEDFHLWHAT
jgi:hypothetical protein